MKCHKMPHNAAFYLGLHCLPKYSVRCFRSKKRLTFVTEHYAVINYIYLDCLHLSKPHISLFVHVVTSILISFLANSLRSR